MHGGSFNAPPDEELHPDLLRRVDEVLPLRDLALALRVGGEDLGVPEVRCLCCVAISASATKAGNQSIDSARTPKTASLPRMASLSDSLSQRFPLTTSTPLAISALLASESTLRETARGVYFPSASTAFRTADPARRTCELYVRQLPHSSNAPCVPVAPKMVMIGMVFKLSGCGGCECRVECTRPLYSRLLATRRRRMTIARLSGS